ncbi:hypothetical protein THAOC_09005, partial [Thalassiosira oceanica]
DGAFRADALRQGRDGRRALARRAARVAAGVGHREPETLLLDRRLPDAPVVHGDLHLELVRGLVHDLYIAALVFPSRGDEGRRQCAHQCGVRQFIDGSVDSLQHEQAGNHQSDEIQVSEYCQLKFVEVVYLSTIDLNRNWIMPKCYFLLNRKIKSVASITSADDCMSNVGVILLVPAYCHMRMGLI